MHKYLNNVLLLTCILFPQTNIAQDKSITLEDVLAKVESTYDYENIRYDSLLNLTNHLIFDTNVLPKIDLSSKMPNYEKSISMVSQYDGSYNYKSRTYATSELVFNVKQLIPMTGGTLSFTSGLNRLDNLTNSNNKTYGYYYNIGNFSYKQSLFAFNEYKWTKRQDEISKTIENVQYYQNIESIKLKIIQSFFNLLLEQRKIELTQQNLELSSRIYNKALLLLDHHRITSTDLIDAKIEYLKEKSTNNSLAYNKALNDFNTLLNLSSMERKVVFNDTIETYEYVDFNMGKVLQRAIEFNYSLIKNQKELYQFIEIKKAIAGIKPKIQLELGFGYNSQFEKFEDAYDDKINSKLISLTLSVPIYNGGLNRYKKKIAVIKLDKLRAEYQTDIKQAWNTYLDDLANMKFIIAEMNRYKITLKLIKQQIAIIELKIEKGRLDIEQYLRIKTEYTKCFVEYYHMLSKYYSYIYKYRSLALYDISTNKEVVDFN